MQARISQLSKTELKRLCVALSSELGPQASVRALDSLAASSGATPPAASSASAAPQLQASSTGRASSAKQFDLSLYGTRRIALRVAYFGERYQGFASSDPADQSVETQLLAALRKVRLIAPDSDAPPGDYSRCGRTDRGVSALGQVVALSVRRSAKAGAVEDMDYCGVLNRVLPEDILVTAWAPCSAEFDARFKCSSRTYRYYCVLPAESTNLDAMRRACRLFEGTHDFRNFCKMDVENAKHFVRRVESCRLVLEDEHGTGLGYCEIRGSAFLWHQVRMMMAVLFLVGQGLESPDLVTQMFNVEAMPRRPGYNMAPEAPLILFGTEFSEPLDWRISEQAKARLAQTLRARHESLSLSAAMSRAVLLGAFLDGERGGAAAAASSPLPPHVPLSARPVGKSYEEKVQALKGDKRLKHSAQRQGQESEEQSSHVAASFSSPLATDSASSARSFE